MTENKITFEEEYKNLFKTLHENKLDEYIE